MGVSSTNSRGVLSEEKRSMNLVARAAITDQSEEDGKERREKNSPGDAARPGVEHGKEASLDLVLLD